MEYTLLSGKIHRATVTDANLHYEGSITIDQDLLEAAHIPLYALVQVYNITNGERFETYTIPGGHGSGEIILNGAAAHKVTPGDLIIVACYVQVEAGDVPSHRPFMVYVDGENSIVEAKQV